VGAVDCNVAGNIGDDIDGGGGQHYVDLNLLLFCSNPDF